MIKVGIVGGAGYTGGELLRLLVNHPEANIIFVHSKSNAGNTVASVHGDLAGETSLLFSDKLNDDIEVLFLCVGHGEAKKFLQNNSIADNVRIIDLSQDFRLKEANILKASEGSNDSNGLSPSKGKNERRFVYGLPELNKEEIRRAFNIANPGCFATALQLGLLPLAKAGLLKDVYTTGITGSTGAGQGLSPTSHFSWRANNIQAYKTLTHQHLKEVGQSLTQLNDKSDIDINFVPWRGDFTRGIFISSQLKCDLSQTELDELYESFYNDHPFTIISKEPIYLKQVVNTNKCFIQLEKVGDKLVVHSIIDNLLKGASGHAVQNMNLMFGIDETTGLRLKANYF
ncbi:N-acetyl-gamma-glutamyl-phosphate reductase [Flavitalea sp.]|nr:N-acetyl-gamma-glutamyl-phosphate reductase [Flavitalea sp.]